MKIFIIILMFVVTLCAMYYIAENGREVKVGLSTASRHLTSTGCVAVAIIAVAYDVVSLYLLVCGV